MKKIALFVEGQTEQIFVSKLLNNIFTEQKINIVKHEMYKLHYNISIEKLTTDNSKDYYFLICDCGTDDKVKSCILDNYQNLRKAGFNYIIGLQDFYNSKRRKAGFTAERFKKGLNYDLEQLIPTEIFLAIQETEAWFIAEEKHYEAIIPGFSLDNINAIAGINIQVDDSQKISHPTVVLDKIYKAGGRTSGYSKKEHVIIEIVSKLDFTNLYFNVRYRNNSLNELLICLDGLIP
jgi:hypothetical protein